jgi:hypothetical protein
MPFQNREYSGYFKFKYSDNLNLELVLQIFGGIYKTYYYIITFFVKMDCFSIEKVTDLKNLYHSSKLVRSLVKPHQNLATISKFNREYSGYFKFKYSDNLNLELVLQIFDGIYKNCYYIITFFVKIHCFSIEKVTNLKDLYYSSKLVRGFDNTTP